MCVTGDVARHVRELLEEINHSALVIVANGKSGIAAHEALASVEACARLIDEVSPGIAEQIRAYAETRSEH